MAAKTSGELEKEFIDGLKQNTGKDLSGWLAEIDAFDGKKRGDILNRLKTEYAFGHMNASFLTGIFLNGGKPVYASTADLLENQFAKAEAMRPLYEALLEFVKTNFPASSVLPKKTYVSILEKREFAAINIKPAELRVGFDLGDKAFDEKVGKSKMTGPMPRISHMVTITDASQLNSEISALLQESYSRSH